MCVGFNSLHFVMSGTGDPNPEAHGEPCLEAPLLDSEAARWDRWELFVLRALYPLPPSLMSTHRGAKLFPQRY